MFGIINTDIRIIIPSGRMIKIVVGIIKQKFYFKKNVLAFIMTNTFLLIIISQLITILKLIQRAYKYKFIY